MSKRSHRNRHHGRPGRAPAPLPVEQCAFVPCVQPTAWMVAGIGPVPGGVAVAAAYVCELHLDESLNEMGQYAEPACAPIDKADELIAFIEEFSGQEMRHVS